MASTRSPARKAAKTAGKAGLYANIHAHTLFGYAAGQLSGATIEQLIP